MSETKNLSFTRNDVVIIIHNYDIEELDSTTTILEFISLPPPLWEDPYNQKNIREWKYFQQAIGFVVVENKKDFYSVLHEMAFLISSYRKHIKNSLLSIEIKL